MIIPSLQVHLQLEEQSVCDSLCHHQHRSSSHLRGVVHLEADVEWDDGNEAVHTREDCPGTAVQRLYLVKKIKSGQ